MSTSYWREYDHPADIGIEAWADSYVKLVLECGIAFSELTTNIESIPSNKTYDIIVEGEELDILLVEFLNELLFLLETEDFIATQFEKPGYFTDKDKFIFTTKAKGGKWIQGEHESKADIKAVTYHDLEVKMYRSDLWYARILFDV